MSIDPSGDVVVDVGVGAQGQAHETTLAQIAAAELGVPIERVLVRGGDTERVGFGMGTIASRVAAVAGPAVARSSREVVRKAKLVAAELFECAAADVVVAGGVVHVAGAPDRSLPLGRVCTPQEVARLVVFLCSEQNTYINGALVPIDGGQRKALMDV